MRHRNLIKGIDMDFCLSNFNGDKLAFLAFWQHRRWQGWVMPEGATWAQFRAAVRASSK